MAPSLPPDKCRGAFIIGNASQIVQKFSRLTRSDPSLEGQEIGIPYRGGAILLLLKGLIFADSASRSKKSDTASL